MTPPTTPIEVLPEKPEELQKFLREKDPAAIQQALAQLKTPVELQKFMHVLEGEETTVPGDQQNRFDMIAAALADTLVNSNLKLLKVKAEQTTNVQVQEEIYESADRIKNFVKNTETQAKFTLLLNALTSLRNLRWKVSERTGDSTTPSPERSFSQRIGNAYREKGLWEAVKEGWNVASETVKAGFSYLKDVPYVEGFIREVGKLWENTPQWAKIGGGVLAGGTLLWSLLGSSATSAVSAIGASGAVGVGAGLGALGIGGTFVYEWARQFFGLTTPPARLKFNPKKDLGIPIDWDCDLDAGEIMKKLAFWKNEGDYGLKYNAITSDRSLTIEYSGADGTKHEFILKQYQPSSGEPYYVLQRGQDENTRVVPKYKTKHIIGVSVEGKYVVLHVQGGKETISPWNLQKYFSEVTASNLSLSAATIPVHNEVTLEALPAGSNKPAEAEKKIDPEAKDEKDGSKGKKTDGKSESTPPAVKKEEKPQAKKEEEPSTNLKEKKEEDKIPPAKQDSEKK